MYKIIQIIDNKYLKWAQLINGLKLRMKEEKSSILIRL